MQTHLFFFFWRKFNTGIEWGQKISISNSFVIIFVLFALHFWIVSNNRQWPDTNCKQVVSIRLNQRDAWIPCQFVLPKIFVCWKFGYTHLLSQTPPCELWIKMPNIFLSTQTISETVWVPWFSYLNVRYLCKPLV